MSIQHLPSNARGAAAADDCGCESDQGPTNAPAANDDLINVHLGVGDIATVNADIGTGNLLDVNADIGTDDYSGIGLKVAALADAGLLDISAGLGTDPGVSVDANADLSLDCIGSVVGDVLSINLPDIGLLDHATC
jgi:hypothetical protein